MTKFTAETNKRAWEIRRNAAKKYNCSVLEIAWKECLKMAKQSHKSVLLRKPVKTRKAPKQIIAHRTVKHNGTNAGKNIICGIEHGLSWYRSFTILDKATIKYQYEFCGTVKLPVCYMHEIGQDFPIRFEGEEAIKTFNEITA